MPRTVSDAFLMPSRIASSKLSGDSALSSMVLAIDIGTSTVTRGGVPAPATRGDHDRRALVYPVGTAVNPPRRRRSATTPGRDDGAAPGPVVRRTAPSPARQPCRSGTGV